ncbi:hypothetical protein OG225_40290 (plasmid) [Nocardia sp. NBC_01377]|uniref:TY-Chap domain-containing protein n=1 Tax=Nocardia sp. NBC_01377 TaxID=2903595 RepID=UPI002F91525B
MVGLREALGDPVYGTLHHTMGLCWDLPGVVVGVVRDPSDKIVLQLVGPSVIEHGRTRWLHHATSDIARRSWIQLHDDLATLLVVDLPTGSRLRLGGGDNWFARFTAHPDTVEVELGNPDFLDPRWRLPSHHQFMTDHLGWYEPSDTRPTWHRHLPLPATFADYVKLARAVTWALRARKSCEPEDLEIHIEEAATTHTVAWPWS